MNSNIYVNEKTREFYHVANDEDYGYFEIETLKYEGFHFIEYLNEVEEIALLDEIKKLSVTKKIKLIKKLEAEWNLMKCYRFNLTEVRSEYLQEFYDNPGYEMEFDREDYMYWLENYLSDWFNGIDYSDLDVILSFLEENTEDFYFDILQGCSQGDYCYVWNRTLRKYWKQRKDLREYLENIAYSSWVTIFESNEDGEIGELIENVPDYYVCDDRENIYLSEYMMGKYQARLAKEDITYY